MTHPLDRLSARLLLGALLLTAIAVQLAAGVASGIVRGFVGPTPLADPRLSSSVGTLATMLVVMLLARGAGLHWNRVFGPPLTRESVATLLPAMAVNIVAILMLISSASVLIMVPLSYVTPAFVERYFLTTQPLFVARSWTELALLLVVGGVLAPIAEEVFFRGLLMQRWARRWGTLVGVLASSAVFGLLHQEWIGRFLTGVLFSALYLRTRRLWVPIIAHSLTNVLVLGSFGAYRVLNPAVPVRTTLAELRDAVPSSALKLAVGVLMVVAYLRVYWPGGMLGRVLTAAVPYEDAGDGSRGGG